jgi:hypothetical protein
VSASTADIVLNFRRELTFRTGSNTRKGEVHIDRLSFLEERHCWGCYWSVSFVRPRSDQPIFGEDALQALTLTLALISSLLRDPGTPGLQIWWLSEGDNGGFPVQLADILAA